MSPVAEIQFMCMGYLNFWHALTYRNATAKKTTVNSIISASCMRDLPYCVRTIASAISLNESHRAAQADSAFFIARENYTLLGPTNRPSLN
jgi:hypothetical protein